MQLYDLMSPVENMLAIKADLAREPLGGTMELLPLCNMDCKMCFIRQNPNEMKKQGRMLSCDEWLKIAQDAKENGVLYLLLTGGEPLLYPEFKRLYTELTNMGFIITINTNGTLIDEDIVNLFANRPCRRLNITLYGTDDETYSRLCKNPYGYSQIMNAVSLLKERNIPFRFNYSITPDNYHQLKKACEIAKHFNVDIEAVSYMFPPIRRENTSFTRLSSKEAAQAEIDCFTYKNTNIDISIAARNTLNLMNNPNKDKNIEGITCRAGRSGFWMSWNGNLLPCGMFIEPKISLLEHSFKDCWEYIVEETSKLRMYSGCKTCDKRNICHVCAAGCLCESGGNMESKPEYICERTEEYNHLLEEITNGSKIDE